MSEILMFLIAQTVALGLIILGSWIATKVQIAKLEVKVAGLQADHAIARKERRALTTELTTMGKNLAELSGWCKRAGEQL